MTLLSSSPVEDSHAEPSIHPLLRAGWMIGQDLISTLVYAALFAATHNLTLSTAMGIGAGLASVALSLLRGRTVGRMQWMSLGLVVVFGGAGLLLHDARFVMIKPTVIYIAVAIVMARAGWMAGYMPPIVRQHGGDIVRLFERAWALGMVAIAAINAVLALRGDVVQWSLFITTAPIAAKLVLVATQYATLRLLVRRRVVAARTQP